MIKLSGCFDNAVPSPRATTNSICALKNDKGFVTPTTTIYIKQINRTIIIPCGLKKYIQELEELLYFLPIQEAIPFLIKKYNIPVPRKPTYQLRRYIYPTADKKIEFPIIQFNSSFRLGTKLSSGGSPSGNFINSDIYSLDVCNDDTRTFSSTLSDMKVNATYWLSTLPIPCYFVARPTNSNTKNIITGRLSYGNGIDSDKIIFSVIVLKTLYAFYDELPSGTNITILYKSLELPSILQFTSTGKLLDDIRNNIYDF